MKHPAFQSIWTPQLSQQFDMSETIRELKTFYAFAPITTNNAKHFIDNNLTIEEDIEKKVYIPYLKQLQEFKEVIEKSIKK